MGRIEPREWVTFNVPNDPNDTSDVTDTQVWQLDVTFLTSSYRCIYGKGCKGGWGATEPAQGCCHTGPYFNPDEEMIRLETAIHDLLTPANADNYEAITSAKGWYVKQSKPGTEENWQNSRRVRRVEGNCIFLNTGKKPGASIGCSLHAAAVDAGQSHISAKPKICWMVPLNVEDREGNGVMTITHWDRDNEGGWGDVDNDWWCCEDQAAYVNDGHETWEIMSEELRTIMGDAAWMIAREYFVNRRRNQVNGGRLHKRDQPVSVRLIPKPSETDKMPQEPSKAS